MPATTKFFFFIIALMPLAALGHDLYVMYDTGNAFAFSSIGWMLKNYAYDFYRDFALGVGVERFKAEYVPLLEKRTFFVTLGLAAVLYAWIILFWVLGWWPFGYPNTSGTADYKGRGQAKSSRGKRFEYKRR